MRYKMWIKSPRGFWGLKILPVLLTGVVGWAGGNSLACCQESTTVELDEEAQAAEQRLRQLLPADSEAAAMLDAIVQGRSMTRNDGWFNLAKPQSAYAWDHMLQMYDSDSDGQLSFDEFPGQKKWFQRLDRNGDGVLSKEDHRWNIEPASTSLIRLIRRLDADDNGRITREEFQQFQETLLADDQDYWSVDELRLALDPPPRATNPSSERPTASQLMIGLEKQEIGSHLPGPDVGEIAMDFTLKSVDGKSLTLSDLCAEKPVVLIFGNFTCGPFRAEAGNLERLYERYQNEFNFLVVYVREAHPSDGWAMRRNEAAEIVLPQPTKYAERASVAQQCQNFMGEKIPLVVDEMDDPVGRYYSGMPSRLYLLDGQRQVLFKSGRGPHYFVPTELEEALLWHLVETDQAIENGETPTTEASEQTDQRTTASSPADADTSQSTWDRMGIRFPQLPDWAVKLSDPLPESTLALMKLDYRHRHQNPLGDLIAAQIRWVVADAMNCGYAELSAEYDLSRLGWSRDEIAAWKQQVATREDTNQRLWDFARQLTLAGHAISDANFAELLETWQPESTVAIVHTVAFANFQNRLYSALHCSVTAANPVGAVLPPQDWRSPDAAPAPERPQLETTPDQLNTLAIPITGAGWTSPNFGLIQSKLDQQKRRASRIPFPAPSRLESLPEEERIRSEKVIWSLISLGYQRELTQGWFELMRTFRRESNLDRVFANSMFWVVTRTNECFY